MVTCPAGHESATDDYCEVCGLSITQTRASGLSGPPDAASSLWPPAAGGDPAATATAEFCPRCATPREGNEAFCEECRYDFTAGDGDGWQLPTPFSAGAPAPEKSTLPPLLEPVPAPISVPALGSAAMPAAEPDSPGKPPAVWVADITADREYFAAMMARSGPEAQHVSFPPYFPERRIELSGHMVEIGRRRRRSGETPDIDLSSPPEDPGVSHEHAVLVQQPDGTWAVVDRGSTNGTTINMAEDPIRPFLPVPLDDGDRVHVGAWTTITVHQSDSAFPGAAPRL